MKFRHYIYILITLIVVSTQYIKAQVPVLSEKAEISLLTNSPWDKEIYALFGHTAIRVNDPEIGLDIAFNYGVFDFDSPNFIYRFVKGETDYWVAPISFNDYIHSYQQLGVDVTEQTLNLNQKEKQDVFDALAINTLPENRIYRYNYFYDNCSTRPRDIIVKNIEGKVEYIPDNKKESYRDLLHTHLATHPWVLFGIDLVIGADADKTISDRQKDFLPANLEQSFESAKINGIVKRALVSKTILLTNNLKLNTVEEDKYHSLMTPLNTGIILLLITLMVSYLSFTKKHRIRGRIYDSLLFFIAGFAGCLIFFLMFFSEHPCTTNNWNIVWLNPLQVLFACLFLIKPLYKYTYYYHFINFVFLSLFFLVWFIIPQQLNLAFIPYIISLWMRSGINIVQYKEDKSQFR